MEIIKAFNDLFYAPKNIIGTRILVRFIAIFMLYRFSTEIYYADFIYSYDLYASPQFAKIALIISFIASIGLILEAQVSICLIVLSLVFWYLSNVSFAGDGGDNIIRIVLIYLVFIDQRIFSGTSKPGLRVFIHNLAVFAIILQVMILYFVAGTSKASGDMWLQGTAMYYILSTDEFGPPWEILKELFKNPFVTSIASHLTIIYQLGFPFTVYSRLHIPWAIMGIFFHIGIALSMGLLTFSIAMIGLILFTINDVEWAKISEGLKKSMAGKSIAIRQ